MTHAEITFGTSLSKDYLDSSNCNLYTTFFDFLLHADVGSAGFKVYCPCPIPFSVWKVLCCAYFEHYRPILNSVNPVVLPPSTDVIWEKRLTTSFLRDESTAFLHRAECGRAFLNNSKDHLIVVMQACYPNWSSCFLKLLLSAHAMLPGRLVYFCRATTAGY